VSGTGHFSPAAPPFEPTSMVVHATITALHGDDALGKRGEILLRRRGDWRWAVPLDGCPALALPIGGAACDPWANVAMPRAPHDHRNPCCGNIGTPAGAAP
jgi:hypothetical protein